MFIELILNSTTKQSHHYTHVARRYCPELLEARQFVFRGIARAHT
jgi:hypothetical protein